MGVRYWIFGHDNLRWHCLQKDNDRFTFAVNILGVKSFRRIIEPINTCYSACINAKIGGNFLRSALSANFLYDSRDSSIQPRSGHKVDLGLTFAGLGGVLGPWLVGVLSNLIGLRLGFGLNLGFGLLTVLAAFALLRKK